MSGVGEGLLRLQSVDELPQGRAGAGQHATPLYLLIMAVSEKRRVDSTSP